MKRAQLIERLAAIEHERWAHWQRYLHEQCERLPDGRLAIPTQLVFHWERQFATTYDELSEKEKDSDREQVLKILPILEHYIANGNY